MMPQQAAISFTPLPMSEGAALAPAAHGRDPRRPSGHTPSAIGIIRHYLTSLNPAALDMEAVHNELAMRAKIILEYMHQYSIIDVNQGIRQFTAFERQRLHQLGLIPSRKMQPVPAEP